MLRRRSLRGGFGPRSVVHWTCTTVLDRSLIPWNPGVRIRFCLVFWSKIMCCDESFSACHGRNGYYHGWQQNLMHSWYWKGIILYSEAHPAEVPRMRPFPLEILLLWSRRGTQWIHWITNLASCIDCGFKIQSSSTRRCCRATESFKW